MATKINITFFVGTEILNIFYFIMFLKKNNIFQNNGRKKLGGEEQARPFLRERGALDDKNLFKSII